MSFNPTLKTDQSALLIIDVQQALYERSVPIFNGDKLVSNINQLVNNWNASGAVIVYIRHNNKKMLVENTSGWQIHPNVRIVDQAIFIDKKHGDAFINTDLDEKLRKNGVKTVVISGLVSHGCVQATCKGALDLGFNVVLVGDGHSSYRGDAKELIVEWNKKLSELGVSVLSTKQLSDSSKTAA